MYNIIICDDDDIFIEYLTRLLFSAGLNKGDAKIYAYHTGKELIDSLSDFNIIDLLILDIQMPNMDGREAAVLFRQQFPHSLLVLCSGFVKPDVTSFKVSPFRYLLKEYSKVHMCNELSEIIHELSTRKRFPPIILIDSL